MVLPTMTGPRLAVCVFLGLLTAAPAFSEEPLLRFKGQIGSAFENSNDWMSLVAFAPDGCTVASDGAAPDRRPHGLSIWTFPDGQFVRAVGDKPVAISPDWSLLAMEGSLVDLNSGATLLKTPDLVRGGAACFTPDSKHLVIALTSWVRHRGPKQIEVISTRDTSEVSSFCSRYTTALAVSPDNTTLASGHWDNVTLWDLPTGKRTALLRGFGRYVYGLAFSADGRLLAAGTDTGILQLWEVGTRRHLWSLQVGWGDVSNPAFSPDGHLVAAGTYADGTLSVVDVSTGKPVSQVRVSMFGCGHLAFSPDGRNLIVPSNGGEIGPRRFDIGGTIRVYELNVARSAGGRSQQ